MKPVVPVILVLCLGASPVGAQEPPQIGLDPSVVWAASGGSWRAETRQGHYRVLVRHLGGDHVVSEVTVQWIAPDPETSEYQGVRSVVVFDPDLHGPWSFGEPELESRSGILVRLEGTNPYTMEHGELIFRAAALDEIPVVLEGSVGDWGPHAL